MDNIYILQKIVDYVENNLKIELSYEDLAAMAGYSSYHFLHVFSDVVGMPLSTYITRRRLTYSYLSCRIVI